jgi:hypothetical protein
LFSYVCAWKRVLFLDVHAPCSSAPSNSRRSACGDHPERHFRTLRRALFGGRKQKVRDFLVWHFSKSLGRFRGCFGPFQSVSDRFRAFRTVSECFGPFQSVSDRFRAFRTVCKKSGTYRFSSLFLRSDLPQAQVAVQARHPRAGDLTQGSLATEAHLSLAARVASYSFSRR